MDKKLLLVLLLVGVVLVSGCISPETKTKDTSTEKPKNTIPTTGDNQVENTKLTKTDNQVENSKVQESLNIDTTKECGPGEAIQSFDLGREDGTNCVSFQTGRTEISAEPEEPASGGNIGTALASVVNWILRIDGDSNTDSTIGEGSIVDLHGGDGISLVKDGNAVTISSTGTSSATTPPSNGSSGSSTWTLTIPSSKGGSTSMGVGDQSSLRIKGNGATSVSLDNKLRELTISSPAYVWNLAASFFGAGTEIKSGDTIRILGGGATEVSADSSGKTLTVSTPEVKQYQYRTTFGRCQKVDGDWRADIEDPGIDVVSCDIDAKMIAKCTEGKIINYGGHCQTTGSNEDSIQGIGPKYFYGDARGWTSSWSDLPTISEVTLWCDKSSTVLKYMWLTCVREKP